MTDSTASAPAPPKTRLNMAACYGAVSRCTPEEYNDLYARADSATRARLTRCMAERQGVAKPQSTASKRARTVNFAVGAFYGSLHQSRAAQKAVQAELTAMREIGNPVAMQLVSILTELEMTEHRLAACITKIKSATATLSQLRKQK